MVDYRLVRSSRKTVSVQVTAEGEVVVRAPRLYPKYKIEAFLRQKEPWIRARLEALASVPRLPGLSEAEHKALTRPQRPGSLNGPRISLHWWASPTAPSPSVHKRPAGAAAPERET